MTYDEAVYKIIHTPKFKTNSQNGEESRGKSGNVNLLMVMDKLGNPQDSLSVIHIAGTNGKGSTAAFISSILGECGLKVGLFTSPHLVKINERIRIDGKDISDETFLSVYNKVETAISENIKDGGTALSFFEILFVMSVIYFDDNDVDVAVFETGLGGRLDATNILASVVSVITSVGLDHTEYLGDTIEQIAAEKAGIIKCDTPVVYNTGSVAADKIIEEFAVKKGAPLINVAKTDYMINDFTGNGIDFSASSSYYSYRDLKLVDTDALYQVDNAATAIAACNVYSKCLGRKVISSEVIRAGLSAFYWPGRMERLAEGLVIDGAHNPDAMERFVEAVRAIEKDAEFDILFAVAGDKDYETMIDMLCELRPASVCITTLVSDRRISSQYIKAIFEKKLGADTLLYTTDSIEEALKTSYNRARENYRTLYCVGSLYLIGSIKELWR